jgi:hypothetical protein
LKQDFIDGLAYLADIFNLSVQGPEVMNMDATKKLQAFIAKAVDMEEESRVRHPSRLSNSGGSASPGLS